MSKIVAAFVDKKNELLVALDSGKIWMWRDDDVNGGAWWSLPGVPGTEAASLDRAKKESFGR